MRRLWPVFGLIGVLLAVYLSGATDMLRFGWLIDRHEQLMAEIEARPLRSLALYVSGYALAVSLGLPGALLLTLTGGFLFGWVLGGIGALCGAVVGAAFVFLLARHVLADLARRIVAGRMERLGAGFRKDAASLMLFLRLVPLFPFALVNLAASILGVPFWTFLWTTLVGILPGTFTFAFAGSGLQGIIEQESDRLSACRAAGETCTARLDPSALIGTETLVALALLGCLALTPMLARRFLGRRIGEAPSDRAGR